MSDTPRLDDAGLYALGRVEELENGPNDWRSITAADMERELAAAFREGQKLGMVHSSNGRMACNRCDIKDSCEFAFDPYNMDTEPKIDCLASK